MELTSMLWNADLSKRAVVDTRAAAWAPSPEPGVERIFLDRDGEEVARATSIVRYAPGSRFAAHVHGGGEEFLVLEGEFRDEHGVYPRGSYVRNPIGSAHSPFSPAGCTLFVKLRQMRADDRETVRRTGALQACRGVLPLHATAYEEVRLERWPAGRREEPHEHPDGEEILVLEGALADEHGVYPEGTWLRQPAGSRHAGRSDEGCLLWRKRGPR